MGMHKDWWIRATEILNQARKDCEQNPFQYPLGYKDLAIDRLQIELKKNDILSTEHLMKPRIDMAIQLIDFAIDEKRKGDYQS